MKKKSELNKELYTPAEVAKELGITTRTLFTWGDNGKVKFEETKKDDNRYDVIYARVSTAKQIKMLSL